MRPRRRRARGSRPMRDRRTRTSGTRGRSRPDSPRTRTSRRPPSPRTDGRGRRRTPGAASRRTGGGSGPGGGRPSGRILRGDAGDKLDERGADGPRMTTATEYLWFETKSERAFVRITDRVREVVRKSGVREGLVLVSAMHITAAVYVNDDESGLLSDISAWADRLAPPG